MRRAENINPSILEWARETAGLSLEEAAQRIGLTSSQSLTAKEKLEALERGKTRPTRNQLLKIASVYRRPLTTFYRMGPPPTGERGADFRTISGSVPRQDAALLDALLRDVHARQDMVRSILEDDEDVRRLSFVGSMSIKTDVGEAAEQLRSFLEIRSVQEFQGHPSPTALFDDLRERTESQGVFVLLVGNLGSHHTNISERTFRGFAIADEIAPFIVINDQDARTARSFTLIHELVHIFVGTTGISGEPSGDEPRTPLGRIERFCNDVAGEFLLPEELFASVDVFSDRDTASAVIETYAERQNVSEPMIAYRFWRTGRLNSETYRELCSIYRARLHAHRQRERDKVREKEGGPSYYVIRRHRLGKALVHLVGRTLRANEVTHTKAAKMLGVRPSNVEPLIRDVGIIGGTYDPEEVM